MRPTRAVLAALKAEQEASRKVHARREEVAKEYGHSVYMYAPTKIKSLIARVVALEGSSQVALLSAADEMPIETLLGADKASVWVRQRAHSLDPEGHKLVQAIHERKAEG